MGRRVNLEQFAKVRGVLFDLDGTLLQVEMREFIPAYIEGLADGGGCFSHRR
jgi:hypothetical protein